MCLEARERVMAKIVTDKILDSKAILVQVLQEVLYPQACAGGAC